MCENVTFSVRRYVSGRIENNFGINLDGVEIDMFANHVRILGILVGLSTLFQSASAQKSRATVIGRVTDSSGAVIPAASVSFTNIDTGVVVRTRTNGEGNYLSSFLIPGNYRIVAEKTGFKNLVQNRVTLSVNDKVELNLKLEVGNQAESVMVTADMSLLDSANVTVGRVVASEEVRNLPIHLGDVDNIVRL